MPNGNNSNVTIKLDGLLLYHFHEASNICEVRVHTFDNAHEMIIKVAAAGEELFNGSFSAGDLKSLHPLSFFVGEGDRLKPVGDSATKGASYDLILDLEGEDFYERSLEVKEDRYKCSLFIRNGVVDAGDRKREGCFRVEKPIFKKLKLHWASEAEFTAFKEKKIRTGGITQKTHNFMKEFGREIAVNVAAKLKLKEGQALRLFSGATNSDLFPPLTHGKKYQIDITYLDINTPMGLADDLGFAHHSAAMRLGAGERIFGLFQPIFDDLPVDPATPPGCCISCRVAPQNGSLGLLAQIPGAGEVALENGTMEASDKGMQVAMKKAKPVRAAQKAKKSVETGKRRRGGRSGADFSDKAK
jgi:hypothetical protein